MDFKAIVTYGTVTENLSIHVTVSEGRYPQRANETQATGKNSAIVVRYCRGY